MQNTNGKNRHSTSNFELEFSDPEIMATLETCGEQERKLVLSAIKNAYEAGRRDADRHSAAFVGRVFAALVGIDAGIDNEAETDRTTVGRIAHLLRGLVGH